MTKTDLDVDVPWKVADVLRAASDKFYESEGELESAWQESSSSSRVWRDIALILSRAATQVDRAVAKRGLSR